MVISRVTGTNIIFKGIAISPGIVAAPACLFSSEFHRTVPEYRLSGQDDITKELERFHEVLSTCTVELDTAYRRTVEKIGKAEADIFMVQREIMLDKVIVERVVADIRDKRKNAEHAVFSVYNSYEEQFMALEDEYLKGRAHDIVDIRQRLLGHLKKVHPIFICEGQDHCIRGQDRIIVTQALSLSMITHINAPRVKGFITEHGGPSSHAAIIARTLGVPAVSGIHNIMETIKCSDIIVIDGDRGEVVLRPDAQTLARAKAAEEQRITREVAVLSPQGAEVLANASSIDDAVNAARFNADGIGLFRTEFIFIKTGRLLSEEEQFEYYAQAAAPMEGKPVTFRLLDVGGDKPLPFLSIEKEDNPYLGWRGSRFLLDNPDVLATQVRAFARLSRLREVRLLFPMVIDLRQLRLLLRARDDALEQVEYNKANLKTGVMIEVPGAIFQLGSMLELVDFASIGSNDLIQYLFAVDRNNEHVIEGYDQDHPVLWKVLEEISLAGRSAGKPVSLCGEMAGMPGIAGRLMAIGISSISVSPPFIPKVRSELISFSRGRAGYSMPAQ